MRIRTCHIGSAGPRAAGYTLIEALLLVIILGITAAGAASWLSSVSASTQADNNTSLIDTTLVTQMETLRATWATRGVGVKTSSITVGNAPYTLTTDVEEANPGDGVQTTFYSLSVQLAGRTLNSYAMTP
jgi:type II secretory pathway pseudopilin PulG